MFPFFGGLNGDGYECDMDSDTYIRGEDGGCGYPRKQVQCNICKSIRVYWRLVCGQWVLFDKNADMKTRKDACHACHRSRFERITNRADSRSERAER